MGLRDPQVPIHGSQRLEAAFAAKFTLQSAYTDDITGVASPTRE